MSRRNIKENNVKVMPKAKRKLIIMFVSVALMFFSVIQVYNLTRYTLGLEVTKGQMYVYRFVLDLVTDEDAVT